MITNKIVLDISAIGSIREMHLFLTQAFGFPDFYGANTHALIDCLSSLRFPEDEMLSISLKEDEQILIEINNYRFKTDTERTIIDELFFAISAVNSWYLKKSQRAPILLMIAGP